MRRRGLALALCAACLCFAAPRTARPALRVDLPASLSEVQEPLAVEAAERYCATELEVGLSCLLSLSVT